VQEIEYCKAYHCAGDCGQPHNQKEMRDFLTSQPAPVQEPVAWMFEFPDKRVKPKFDSAPHGGKWQPLYIQPPPDAYGYAKRLAVAIWKKHYQFTAPQWEPFDDLMDVLTQIDNMTSGLTTPPAQPAPVAKPHEQEPIAYLHQCGKKPELKELSFKKNEPLLAAKGYKAIPLTSPPAQRKPLTDEEISSMMSKNLRSPEGTYFYFARDIEAKLKAKNSL
jgi:hypothetical protein